MHRRSLPHQLSLAGRAPHVSITRDASRSQNERETSSAQLPIPRTREANVTGGSVYEFLPTNAIFVRQKPKKPNPKLGKT